VFAIWSTGVRAALLGALAVFVLLLEVAPRPRGTGRDGCARTRSSGGGSDDAGGDARMNTAPRTPSALVKKSPRMPPANPPMKPRTSHPSRFRGHAGDTGTPPASTA